MLRLDPIGLLVKKILAHVKWWGAGGGKNVPIGSWGMEQSDHCVPCGRLFWLWQLGRRIGAQTVNSNMLADLEKRVKKVKRAGSFG